VVALASPMEVVRLLAKLAHSIIQALKIVIVRGRRP
jgi:hypothetical protein